MSSRIKKLRPRLKQFKPETDIGRNFIDAVRECLGMGPLYAPDIIKSDVERFYRRHPSVDLGFDDNGNRRNGRQPYA